MPIPKRKIIPYNPELTQLARQLRNNSTKSEIILWLALKGKQMRGYDFHRQKPLGNFIVDFFCYELMLAIEIDGYSHTFAEVLAKDERKENALKEFGVYVLHIDDAEVYWDLPNALASIEEYIDGYEAKHGRVID
jgi:very-short-patch-repair endonuclease